MGNRPHVHPQSGFVEQQPGQGQHQQHEDDHRDAVVRQDEVGQHRPAAGEPAWVSHLQVLRPKQQAHQLDQHQADAPGRQQGLQRATIEMANDQPLQRHPHRGGNEKGHRQGNDGIEGQPLRGETGKEILHQPGGVCPQHQHLAVGHVDHPQQAVGNGQAKGGQQQDRSQRQSAKGLPQPVTPAQALLDLLQAVCSGGAHAGIRLVLRLGEALKAGLDRRGATLAQLLNRLQAHLWTRIGELESGDGQQQGRLHLVILLLGQPLLDQRKLLRRGVVLQITRGGETQGTILADQLVGGESVSHQGTDAVIHKDPARAPLGGRVALQWRKGLSRLGKKLAALIDDHVLLAKRLKQGQTRRIGRGGPGL